jgi:hypothetical protein
MKVRRLEHRRDHKSAAAASAEISNESARKTTTRGAGSRPNGGGARAALHLHAPDSTLAALEFFLTHYYAHRAAAPAPREVSFARAKARGAA